MTYDVEERFPWAVWYCGILWLRCRYYGDACDELRRLLRGRV